ncbi:MAG: vitamin K epoxide reductase family protein [Acidobacteria bacterium]|nr:vitamin K epoxide reductase family protein [Acidobacteriota bacterium]
MTLAIGLLAAVGLAISSYFTAVAYRWTPPNVRWIPSFCRLEERTCASVVFTPSARVFGPPNSLLGQVFYAALLAGAASGRLADPHLWWLYLGVSLVTVGLGVYLSHALLFVLRVPCPLCFVSHGVNAVICGLLLFLPHAGGW